jgi:hypothetical protein
MSTAARKWAWPQKLAPMDKLVLLALADLADPYDCYASKGKLSEMTGISTRRVGDVLARLQSAGIIKLIASTRIENGRRMACDWLLLTSAIHDDAASSRTPRHQGRSVTNDDDATSPTMVTQRHPNQKNQKKTEISADAPTPAISSPSLPSSEKEVPKPKRAPAPKFDPSSLPLPHGPGLASAWAEFAQHRREIKAPLTPTAAKRIVDDLAAVNEAAAAEALRKSVKHGWRGVFVDPPPTAPKLVTLPPQGQPKQTALEKHLAEQREQFAKENAA